jgi:hypothetical protein
MSGTALQVHGAAMGNGVYLAEDPRSTWAYSKADTLLNQPGSTLNNLRALLGVRFTGSTSSYPGLQVVSDEKTLRVRHIFLIPFAVESVPTAAQVEPALSIMYNSLRCSLA